MRVPIERLVPEDWQRFRTLRLRALKDSPDAFWTTYEQALGQPEQIWRERLASTVYFTTGDDLARSDQR